MDPEVTEIQILSLRRRSNGSGFSVDASRPLGAGGEARIYEVPGEPGLVVKLYRKPTLEKERKLTVMIARPPPGLVQEPPALAWPTDLVDEEGRGFAGFLMPRVQEPRRLFELYNPASRRQRFPGFDYGHLHRTARNLAATAASLHEAGYIIGDINESNILVARDAQVTVLDTDSFRVPDPDRMRPFLCPVAKPEFTSPELQGKSFTVVDQTLEDDLFGLAVLLFLVLMEGTHPFAGEHEGEGEPPLFGERIARGHFPYSKRRKVPYRPRRLAPPLELLHPRLSDLFLRCFDDGHASPRARPSAGEFVQALDEAEAALIRCPDSALHRFGGHLPACPWCERRELLGGRDPFPAASRAALAPLPAPVSTPAAPGAIEQRARDRDAVAADLAEIRRLQTQIAANTDCVRPRTLLAELLHRGGKTSEAVQMVWRAAEAFRRGGRATDDLRSILRMAQRLGGGSGLSDALRRVEIQASEAPLVPELGSLEKLGLSEPIYRHVKRLLKDQQEEARRLAAATARPARASRSRDGSVVLALLATATLYLWPVLASGPGRELFTNATLCAVLLGVNLLFCLAPLTPFQARSFLGLIRRASKVPTGTARSRVGMGPVLVTGRALRDGPPLRSPITGTPCVFWRVDVRRLGTDGLAKGPPLRHEQSDRKFEVDDGSGRIRVDPLAARDDVALRTQLVGTQSTYRDQLTRSLATGPALKTLNQMGGLAGERLQASEWFVREGDVISVLGALGPDGPGLQIEAPTASPLLLVGDWEQFSSSVKKAWSRYWTATAVLLSLAWAATLLSRR